MRHIIKIFFCALLLLNKFVFVMDNAYQRVHKEILDNPSGVYQENKRLKEEFFAGIKAIDNKKYMSQTLIDKLGILCTQYEEQSPIFLIDECFKNSFPPCPFNRN